MKAFHATIVRQEPRTGEASAELPIVRDVTESVIRGVFLQVKRDVWTLVKEEMRRILKGPVLAQKVLKK